MESHVNVAKTLTGLLQPSQVSGFADSDRSSDLSSAVHKFEAFFIQSMLKSMRAASLSNGLFDSEKSNFYRDWHDQQLAGNLASSETFAVAKLLRQQFSSESEASNAYSSLQVNELFKHSAYATGGAPVVKTLVASVGSPAGLENNSVKTTLKQLVTKTIKENSEPLYHTAPTTPEQFVQHVYPHAHQAATKLNTSADVLVAIAALETGWGLHMPKASHGQESFNYFGIKANNWSGMQVTNLTREFDGEKMVVVKDDFRAYESPADSFNDFAEFLLNNPRYKQAIINSGDNQAFVTELQKAGYATDPSYAKKVNSILNGSILKNALHMLSADEIKNQEVAEKVTGHYETSYAN